MLARAVMHHSANYRSAMLFGAGEWIEDEAEKLTALEALVEKLVPGRWGDARVPTEKELRATALLRIPLEEASAKIRIGPPIDDEPTSSCPSGREWSACARSRPSPSPTRCSRRVSSPRLPGRDAGRWGGS